MMALPHLDLLCCCPLGDNDALLWLLVGVMADVSTVTSLSPPPPLLPTTMFLFTTAAAAEVVSTVMRWSRTIPLDAVTMAGVATAALLIALGRSLSTAERRAMKSSSSGAAAPSPDESDLTEAACCTGALWKSCMCACNRVR